MLRSELLKLRSHRLPWIAYGVLALLLAVVSLLVALNWESSPYPTFLVPVAVNGTIGIIFAVILGGWAGGSEFGWGTYRVVLARDDRRSLHFLAKLAVVLGLTVVGLAVALVVGLVGSLLGHALNPGPTASPDIAGGLKAALLYQLVLTAVAFGVGMATRSTAVAISVCLAVFLVVQTALMAFPKVAAFTLGLSLAIAAGASPDPEMGTGELSATYGVGATRAWVTVGVYLVLVLGAAWLTFVRRDVGDAT